MSRSTGRTRTRGRHRKVRTTRPALVLAAAFLAVLVGAGSAAAYWSATGSGSGSASASTLVAPVDVTVPPAAESDVPVSWTPGTGGTTPAGYYVTRHTGSTSEAACGSGPLALLTDTTCVDTAVPDGVYAYVVTAVFATWTATSVPSGAVSVAEPVALVFTGQPTDTPEDETITPPVTVALRTVGGDPAPTAGISVTVSIGTNPAGGTLTGTTLALTDADGVASFDDLSIDTAGVGYTLTALSPGLPLATSAAFTVTTPAPFGAAQERRAFAVPYSDPVSGYSILAATAVTNTGTTTEISGDLGVSPGNSITGFPSGIVSGEIHAGDTDAAAAQAAFTDVYDEMANLDADTEVAGEIGGLTLTPGVYHSVAALSITGTLILDGQGDPNAVFVFQTDAAFDTAAASVVSLVNGASVENVYWVVAGAAGTGANSYLYGAVLAQGAITLGASTVLIGRALSGDAVTMGPVIVRFTDALPPTATIDGGAVSSTQDTTATITGTTNAPESSPVTVTVAGQTLYTTVFGGTWSVTTTALDAGVHQVVAKVRDPSGNGGSAAQELTVEVNPPVVDLGTASTFSVLAGPSVVNTGGTTLSGDLGVSPGTSVTGFAPGTFDGTSHLNDDAAVQAQADLLAAIDDASSRMPHTEIVGDLGGRTFRIGVHHSLAALALTGTLTLDGGGDPNAVFIFQTDAAFNTAAASVVNLINGASADNVFWVVGDAAGTGADSFLSGTILARGAITLGASTALVGRALSRVAVTLGDDILTGVTPAPPAAPMAAAPLPAAVIPEEIAPVPVSPDAPDPAGDSVETEPEGADADDLEPGTTQPDAPPVTTEPAAPPPTSTAGDAEPDGTVTP